MTTDVLVWFEAERYDWNETKCEPFPALVHTRTEVAAVLALRCDILIAFEERLKGCRVRSAYVKSEATGGRRTVRATSEYEGHIGCVVATERRGKMRCGALISAMSRSLRFMLMA